MKANEYVKTLVVYGKMVNIGMDDYGQQYFIEYVDNNGDLVEVCCGAYVLDYEDVARSIIDPRRYFIEIWGEEAVLEMECAREERMKKYEKEK